jgi:hypothetical protein
LIGACASTPARPPEAHRPASPGTILAGQPLFAKLEADPVLARQFATYWTWISGLGTPDTEYLASLPADDLERSVLLFHEKVELAGWFALAHRLEDITRIEYFQQHYEAVYPLAHRDATQAEMVLLAHFAQHHGLAAPPLALLLVCPMVERRNGATADLMVRRFKFNPQYTAQSVTPADLVTAARVWEAGGYVYRDRARVLAEASSYLQRRAAAASVP